MTPAMISEITAKAGKAIVIFSMQVEMRGKTHFEVISSYPELFAKLNA